MREFELGLGQGTVRVSLPETQIIDVIAGKPYEPIQDIEAAVKKALRNPIGTLPLKEIVKAGDKVAIIASDITRAWLSHDKFLPCLLNELNEAGIPDGDMCLVVALGAHRYHTDQENVSVYGQEVVARVRIEQSCALGVCCKSP